MTRTDYRVIVDGLAFAEGCRLVGGELWFSDMHDRTVYRVDPATGAVRARWETPDKPSGLVVGDDGTVLITQMETRGVVRLDADADADADADGTVHPVADLSAVADWHVNDMTAAPDGGVYVGNFGDESVPPTPPHPARLAHVDRAGTVRAVADDMHFANGMVLVGDGTVLLVAETRSDPPRVTAFDAAPDGTLTGRRSFAEFSGAFMPDGLAATSTGEALVAMPFANALVLLGPDGAVVRTYETDLMPYACAVDESTRTAYACLSSSWEESECLRARDAVVVEFDLDAP